MTVPALNAIDNNSAVPIQNANNHVEEPPFLVRAAKNLALGTFGGYVWYWFDRFFVWIGLLDSKGKNSCVPYLLVGFTSAAIVEAARGAYLVALKIIGNREDYANLQNPEQAPYFSRLRNRCWKVIVLAENVEKRVDSVFSSCLKIRTRHQIKEQAIPDRDLSNMEIIRREFWNQIAETLTLSVPQEISVSLMGHLGFRVLGGHIMLTLHVLTFLTGLHRKVVAVFDKVEAELEEERKRREAQNSPQPQPSDLAQDAQTV